MEKLEMSRLIVRLWDESSNCESQDQIMRVLCGKTKTLKIITVAYHTVKDTDNTDSKPIKPQWKQLYMYSTCM